MIKSPKRLEFQIKEKLEISDFLRIISTVIFTSGNNNAHNEIRAHQVIHKYNYQVKRKKHLKASLEHITIWRWVTKKLCIQAKQPVPKYMQIYPFWNCHSDGSITSFSDGYEEEPAEFQKGTYVLTEDQILKVVYVKRLALQNFPGIAISMHKFCNQSGIF